MTQQDKTRSSVNLAANIFNIFSGTSVRTNSEVSSNSEFTSPVEQDIKPLSIPVSIVVEQKPKFMELYEKVSLNYNCEQSCKNRNSNSSLVSQNKSEEDIFVDNASAEELCEIISELKKPQRMTIKVRELRQEDHSSLWNFFDFYSSRIKSFIRNSLKKSFDGLFEIEKIIFKEGCVYIIVIITTSTVTAPAWVPILGLFIGAASLAVGIISNWDKITSSLTKLKNETVKVYNKFCSFIGDITSKLKDWLDDGHGSQPAT